MNLLAVNIGNSRITWALFRKGMLIEAWHEETSRPKEAARLIADLARTQPVAICSVVPAALDILVNDLTSFGLEFHLLSTSAQTLISGTYDRLGVDRVANAVAAWKLFAREAPALVIDLGTATTLTAVSSEGKFMGGLITLGLGKTLASLHQEAAQLPAISLEGKSPAASALAFDTETAIASGTILAHVGLVEHWLKLARKQLGGESVTVATGGWADTLVRYTRAIEHVDPYLTLKGIYLLSEPEAALAGQA